MRHTIIPEMEGRARESRLTSLIEELEQAATQGDLREVRRVAASVQHLLAGGMVEVWDTPAGLAGKDAINWVRPLRAASSRLRDRVSVLRGQSAHAARDHARRARYTRVTAAVG